MQRLLRYARWDADAVRDDVRAYALDNLGADGGVPIVDENGFVDEPGVERAGLLGTQTRPGEGAGVHVLLIHGVHAPLSSRVGPPAGRTGAGDLPDMQAAQRGGTHRSCGRSPHPRRKWRVRKGHVSWAGAVRTVQTRTPPQTTGAQRQGTPLQARTVEYRLSMTLKRTRPRGAADPCVRHPSRVTFHSHARRTIIVDLVRGAAEHSCARGRKAQLLNPVGYQAMCWSKRVVLTVETVEPFGVPIRSRMSPHRHLSAVCLRTMATPCPAKTVLSRAAASECTMPYDGSSACIPEASKSSAVVPVVLRCRLWPR